MGMRTGSALCQRTTDVIRHIMCSKGLDVYNYIDDVICVHRCKNAVAEFQLLYSLFEYLGLPINPKKVVAPARSLTCMGIVLDVDARTASIPQEKCSEILGLCKFFSNKSYISRRQLQSLLGKLLYLHRCVAPSRFFVNRLLNMLRSGDLKIKITQDTKTTLTGSSNSYKDSMAKCSSITTDCALMSMWMRPCRGWGLFGPITSMLSHVICMLRLLLISHS